MVKIIYYTLKQKRYAENQLGLSIGLSKIF